MIGLNLCPFAQRPFTKGLVRFNVALGEGMEAQLIAFWKEIELLENVPAEEVSNTILIFPEGLDDFGKYLELYEMAEQLLADQNKSTEFQLASFHPDYQFENTHINDVSNYTNRSPYPFIHILRKKEVEEAIKNYPNIEEVPQRNIETMKKLGIKEIKKLLDES